MNEGEIKLECDFFTLKLLNFPPEPKFRLLKARSNVLRPQSETPEKELLDLPSGDVWKSEVTLVLASVWVAGRRH